jgi:hypothetical protein
MYLLAVRDKYRIHFQSPRMKTDLVEDARIINSSINALNVHLTLKYTPEVLQQYVQELERQKARLASVEAQMKMIADPTLFQEYYPLSRTQTLAYVQTNGQMLPLSISNVNDVWRIVYETRSGSTFAELNLPERPDLWVKVRGNKFINVY